MVMRHLLVAEMPFYWLLDMPMHPFPANMVPVHEFGAVSCWLISHSSFFFLLLMIEKFQL
jgi:hypothetical protein